MLTRIFGATQPFLTFDSAAVALFLGIATRALTAVSTKVHDKTVRAIVAGALLVIGSLAAYATNAVGDIALWPDLVIVGGIASALVIGIDRTVIGQVFEFLDRTFPGFWKADPNSVGNPNDVGIGRSAKTLARKSARKMGKNARSHPVQGGAADPTGDAMVDALGPPDLDPSAVPHDAPVTDPPPIQER